MHIITNKSAKYLNLDLKMRNQYYNMGRKLCGVAAFLFVLFNITQAQSLLIQKKEYSHADSLRGSLRDERTCYDVLYYELNIKIDTSSRSITGSNLIRYTALKDFNTLQLDLYDNMSIINITSNGEELKYYREANAVFVMFKNEQKRETKGEIVVNYYGKPTVAVRPPWDGGFTWTHDNNGNFWLGMSCEGMGASLWWPNKDYLGDEPDSMRVICTVPAGLMCVVNGSLERKRENADSTNTSTWFISYPINNYNISINVGDYVHFADIYTSVDGSKLALDYYVMRYNEEKARKQFQQVIPMLTCYEKYIGKYPFWNDGYALIETPYLGMEHQSGIAYGNRYKTGYAGMDFSRIGLDFDYIIIHESAHEWWGNSVSCKDIADMWIHESFATYTESIYVECMYDSAMAQKYINAKKPTVDNKAPIVGIYGVNEEGDGDMYNKGMLFLNTLRHVINNDAKWWATIKCMSDTTFKMKNIDYNDVVKYFNSKLDLELGGVFEQYLKHAAIPELEYSLSKKGGTYYFKYKWNADVKDFEMPVIVWNGKNNLRFNAITGWQTAEINLNKVSDFKINDELMYINVKKVSLDKNSKK